MKWVSCVKSLNFWVMQIVSKVCIVCCFRFSRSSFFNQSIQGATTGIYSWSRDFRPITCQTSEIWGQSQGQPENAIRTTMLRASLIHAGSYRSFSLGFLGQLSSASNCPFPFVKSWSSWHLSKMLLYLLQHLYKNFLETLKLKGWFCWLNIPFALT